MKNLMKFFVFAIALLINLSQISYAQPGKNPANEKYFWVNFGLGKGSVGTHAFALEANSSYQFGKSLITLRSAGTAELFGKSIGDYGLLYGIILKQQPTFVSFGVGLAFVGGSISQGLFSTKEPEKIGPTIGLPLEVQLFFRPARFLGIGLYGFANLNPEESFVGATISLQLGKLI
jgi:hypothetical protein